MSKKIGVSGGIGSFSEEAADYFCHKNGISDYNISHLISVENVLKSLDAKEIDLGIVPIENSNGGIVYEAVYAMSKYVYDIQKLFEIDIRHNLIAKPGTKLEDIKIIASHSQALKQCRMYLKRKWPDVEIKEWKDTADAVRAIKEGELPDNVAAIASKKAAEIYGMEILEESIQDLKFNFTTFLAITRQQEIQSSPDNLEATRKKLDEIDRKILSLLVDRKEAVKDVIVYKIKNSLPIRNLDREKELIDDKTKLSEGKLDSQFVSNMYRLIIEDSCKQQERILKNSNI